MNPRRLKNIITHYLTGGEYYTNYPPRISKAEIKELESQLDIILQTEHTYGAQAGPIAVYPLNKKEFNRKALEYLNPSTFRIESEEIQK
jgi:hypothetical protein